MTKFSRKQIAKRAIEARKKGNTLWMAKLEEPVKESGSNIHLIELGKQGGEHEVKNALMRMHRPNGSPMYYNQDVNTPYLHYIKKVDV